jgi:signal transduction histidine kinase
VGHDLRNPLNAIAIVARSLASVGCPDPSHREQAEHIGRICVRMNRIIEDILDLTRMQLAGGLPLAVGDADLAEICRGVLAELRMVQPQREIVLDVAGDARGQWDGDRLARVVSNLVGNAIRHSLKGPIHVLVADGGSCATLVVHNDGEPLRPEMLALAFQPVQGPSSRVGLGLPIVRAIVQAHGGELAVRSDALGGTSFTVRLPKQAPQPASSDVFPVGTAGARGPAPRRRAP